MHRPRPGSNVALPLGALARAAAGTLALAGCAEPRRETPLADRPPIHRMSQLLAKAQPVASPPPRPPGAPVVHAADLPPPPAAAPSLLSALGADLDGASLDMELGAELAEALAAVDPERVATWGPGALGPDVLFGSDYVGDSLGICEAPELLRAWEEDGTDWEARLELASYFQLASEIVPTTVELDDACREGVAGTDGDVEAAVDQGACDEAVAAAFFPEDGACLDCVSANGGDVGACEGSGACPTEAVAVAQFSGGGATWYKLATSHLLACAPDWVAPITLGYSSDDGSLPDLWDHARWGFLCMSFWDDRAGDISTYCFQGPGGPEQGDAIGEGVVGRVRWIREVGDPAIPHAERLYYAHSATLDDGPTLGAFWAESSGGIGIVSLPSVYTDGNGDGVVDGHDWNTGTGGLGLNPVQLRPDGSDPTSLDDVQARDWLGAVTLKTATTITGVPVNFMNHSRCLDWAGPASDGAYTCTANGWPTPGLQEDTEVFWYTRSKRQIIALPLPTLAATGLADPLVPGGFVPFVAGSEDLANPDWDACTWPHSFVPDHLRAEDDPFDFDASHSLDAATYRFGKEAEADIRIVLTTARPRSFCPEGEG